MYNHSNSGFTRNTSSITSHSARDLLPAGRNISVGSPLNHRRGQSLTGLLSRDNNNTADENSLDLFSRNRRSLSVASSDDSSDASLKLGKLSLASVKLNRGGMDDLLSSTDGGKHDYDWLLTPPETPLFPSTDGTESQPKVAAPRSASLVRSSSISKPSRLSVSQSESSHAVRPSRSNSVTRPSISTSHYSSYSSSRTSSILNTSSASVSSYTRPSSPSTRSSSGARSSTPSARPTSSRPSTPSRSRPTPSTSSLDKARPSQRSRPSTPSSRPHIPANLSSPGSRSTSRPSTPTRRNSLPSLSVALGSSTLSGRMNGRSSAPSSRASSPAPATRPRTPQQPVIPPDFPLDTPPNLRTTLPDRPLSAGRSRPGAALSAKGNSETTGPVNMPKRPSSPIVTRGRLTEPSGRGRLHSNGHAPDVSELRKANHVSDVALRRPVKSSSTVTDSSGFGRTISKKSLDMAIRHMDIRNGTGGVRPLSGTTLFPQSIRSAFSRNQSARGPSIPASVSASDHQPASKNGFMSDNGIHSNRLPGNGSEIDNDRLAAKLSDVDIYESTRYDAIFLKEDLTNTSWLHSVDDKADPIFDTGFEPLPEPFGL